MISYASQTCTKRNIAEIRRCGWRFLISRAAEAKGGWEPHGLPYALDNGRWADFTAGALPFDAPKVDQFGRMLERLGAGADFVVAPDIVLGGADSLKLTREWLPVLLRQLPERVRVLIAVQNGMEAPHVERLLNERVGLAVGGDTDWKEASLTRWAALTHARRSYVHVLRVNTQQRMRRCQIAGVDSCDGSSASRFAVTTDPLDQAVRQADLEGFIARGPMSPAAFEAECQAIVETLAGHKAHRALDLLSNRVLAGLGYGRGVEIFERAVAGWHDKARPYP